MKSLKQYIILAIIGAIIYYSIYVLNYSKKYGVTPMQMRKVVAKEVFNKWLEAMKNYLLANKPTESDLQGMTVDQTNWIDTIKTRTGLISTDYKNLYKNKEYIKAVTENLYYVASIDKTAILSKENIKNLTKTTLDSYGIDYRDPDTIMEFNKQFKKLVK